MRKKFDGCKLRTTRYYYHYYDDYYYYYYYYYVPVLRVTNGMRMTSYYDRHMVLKENIMPPRQSVFYKAS